MMGRWEEALRDDDCIFSHDELFGGFVLVRIHNAAGIAYSVIIDTKGKPVEIYSTLTQNETEMLISFMKIYARRKENV